MVDETSPGMKDPAATCRAALFAIGMPKKVVELIKPGRMMDYLVHVCVMSEPRVDWQTALAMGINAAEELSNQNVFLKLQLRNERDRSTTPFM